jgi:hypothetical protein
MDFLTQMKISRFMKDDKHKIREPFPPEHTPQPPQIKDPSRPQERGESDDGKIKAGEKKKQPEGKKKPSVEEKGKLLNEDADISDETTI